MLSVVHEEKKACDAKSIQYIRIEKNILETVKNVDFEQLMKKKKTIVPQ
jgi:hypothetical protein